MSDSAFYEHLCERVYRMGVPINTLLVFLLWQILQFGSISGLPFASISSLSSLKTETAPNEELSTAYVPNLVQIDSLVPSPGSSSPNFQLFFGVPISSTNYALSLNPSVTEGGYGIPSLDTLTINVPTSFKIQPNCISLAPVSEPSSSIEVTLDVVPSVSSTSTSSGSSTAPDSNKGSKSDLKRDLRDTLSQEPCFSVTQENLAKLTSNCVSNFPSPVFPSMPSLPNIKPMFPNVRMPVNVTRPTINNFFCSSEDSLELSNGECECTFASPFQSPMLTKMNPGPSFQNNLLCSQENPNMLLALNLLNKRAQNSGEIDSAAQSNCCSETVTLNPTPTSLANTLSSFEDIQNCKQTLQSEKIQNQPTIQTKLSPSQMNRLKNNLINSQVLQNNNLASPILQSNTNCEDTMQNRDLKTEYDNVLRIRNSVIPNMLSNNVRVKSIPKNVARNNEENRGCPQLETIQDNTPFIQNNNILLNPTNECRSENNNYVTGSTSFNNLARKLKYNLDDSESNGITVQNNKNQGCPQSSSVPVYNKESLLNKQLCQARALQNNCINVNNNNLNQNVEGCSQLLSIAQNNLYAKKNNEPSINNKDFNSVDKQIQHLDCNCIQTPTPNDNLAQALKMVNRAITANDLASTINILPFGETLLDGKPLSNNLMSVKSISSPTNLPTCPCSKSGNKKPFLTIQDVSSTPFPATPVNSFSLEAPGPIPTNVMLAPSFNPINTMPPIIKNIKMTASVPTISPITNTESPIANPPLIFTQEPYYNSNIQPTYSLLSTPNGISPIVTPTFIPVESLPQVSFVNNLPSSTVSVTPSLSLPNNYLSSMSNLPPICSSIQPVVSPSCPSVPSNLQASSLSGASSMFPSLNMNNMVSSLTQNIISTLISQTSSRIPLGKLPPVNPFTHNLITETSSVSSPVCLDISEPLNYIVSTPLNLPGLSLPSIPVACNEYLPPMYNPAIIPISSFNPDLFYVGSDTDFDCGPFALSTTDAYYPEISFMMPSVGTDSCLCGHLFMPASTLPQSPSVMRINNAGRDAKGFEQLLNCRMS